MTLRMETFPARNAFEKRLVVGLALSATFTTRGHESALYLRSKPMSEWIAVPHQLALYKS